MVQPLFASKEIRKVRATNIMKLVLTLLALVSVVRAQSPEPSLKIFVIEGEGAFNSIRGKTAHSPIVEVRDRQDRVVPGATVRFVLPAAGASGTFPGGALSAESTTDENGKASAPVLVPNSTEGRFNIKVSASSSGREASVVIAQTNTLAGGEQAASHSSKKLLIILLIAGAAGGGAAAALHGGGKSATPATPTPPPIVLTIGGVTVAGPQ
jgi:hypothetical protein